MLFFTSIELKGVPGLVLKNIGETNRKNFSKMWEKFRNIQKIKKISENTEMKRLCTVYTIVPTFYSNKKSMYHCK